MTARLSQVSRAFALLIGINDYRAYDASAGKPPGTSDLPAGRNDVGAFYRMCRALGIPRDNIHILTSPKLGPGDVGEEGEQIPCGYLGEATGAEIRAQLEWLGDRLAHAEGDPDSPIGLFTYSGHGDFADEHLALCPSDVRAGAGDVQGALGFPEIQAILKSKPGGADNLTVVLDCCHAAAAGGSKGRSSRRRGASLTGRARSVGTASPSGGRKSASEIHLLGERMLMAAKPGELAYQSKFEGHDHGALSWSLNVVADQWQVESEGDVDHYTLDHGTLRERAQRLLDALGFSQTLVLYPEGVAHLPFFHRGKGDAGDVVAKAPDRARVGIQVDPDWRPSDWTSIFPPLENGVQPEPDWVRYDFKAGSTLIASALAVRKAGAPDLGTLGATATAPHYYMDGREYWSFTANSLATATQINATAGCWPTSSSNTQALLAFPVADHQGPIYAMSTTAAWPDPEELRSAPTTPTLWGTVPDSGDYLFGFSITTSAPPAWSWVQGTTSNTTVPYVVTGGEATKQGRQAGTLSTTPPTGSLNWSTVTCQTAKLPFLTGAPGSTTFNFSSAPSKLSLAQLGGTHYLAAELSVGTIALFTSPDGYHWSAYDVPNLGGSSPSLFASATTLFLCYVTGTGPYSLLCAPLVPATTGTNPQPASWGTPVTVASGLGSQPAHLAAGMSSAGTAYLAYWNGSTYQYHQKGTGSWSGSSTVATPTSLPSGQGPQAQATSIGFLGTTAHLCARFGGSCHVGQLTAFGSATAVPQGSGTASTGVLSNNRNASALLFAACTLDTGQTVMTCWTSAMIAGTSTFVGTSVDSAYSGAPSNLVMAPFGSGQVALLMTVTPATGDSQLLGAYGVA